MQFYRKIDGKGAIEIKYGEQNVAWGRTHNISLETLDMFMRMLNHHIQEENKNGQNDNNIQR